MIFRFCFLKVSRNFQCCLIYILPRAVENIFIKFWFENFPIKSGCNIVGFWCVIIYRIFRDAGPTNKGFFSKSNWNIYHAKNNFTLSWISVRNRPKLTGPPVQTIWKICPGVND